MARAAVRAALHASLDPISTAATVRAMTAAIPLVTNGTKLSADPSGVLFWAARDTLIVADLHLEKGTSLARRGVLLPPYDTRSTLTRLAAAVERLRPARVICLGDSFHDPAASGRLDDRDRTMLNAMIQGRDWVWVTGNHDPTPPEGLAGEVVDTFVDGPLTFSHEARPSATPGEVSGHYHPVARVRVRGRSVSGRCFVNDGRRLILPAFGAYTGGLDVGTPAIRSLLDKRFEVGLISADRVWRVPSGELTAPPAMRSAL